MPQVSWSAAGSPVSPALPPDHRGAWGLVTAAGAGQSLGPSWPGQAARQEPWHHRGSGHGVVPQTPRSGKARLRVAGAGPSSERGEGSGRVSIPASCQFIFTSRRWGLLQWPPPSRVASGTLYQVLWRARCRSSCREDPARGTMAPSAQAEPEDTASRGWLHGVTRLEGQLPRSPAGLRFVPLPVSHCHCRETWRLGGT